MSCAAYDYVLMFLSELRKDMKATAASKVKQRGNEDDGDGGEYERLEYVMRAPRPANRGTPRQGSIRS